MILQVLFTLASALLARSKLFKQPEDAIYATKYLRRLQEISIEVKYFEQDIIWDHAD